MFDCKTMSDLIFVPQDLTLEFQLFHHGNSITVAFSAIGYVFLFFLIMTTIIQGMFHLVMELPDDVIGWVGGIGKNAMGKGMDDKAHSVFIAGGKFGSGGVDRMSAANRSPRIPQMARLPKPPLPK